MTVPLTPETGLFPDAYVAPFIEAGEIRDLVDEVIASFDEFVSVGIAIRDYGLTIRTVFETKPFDELKEELKPHTIAKVTKASPLWRTLAETEVVIQFRQYFWDQYTEDERRGVIHHELSHIEIGELGADGMPKVSLRDHDVEEFALTVKRFGPRRDHHAAFFRAFMDWHKRTPRPTAVDNDDVDVRPKGEVNADELRGAADRAVEPESKAPTPLGSRRRNGHQSAPPLH